MIQWFIQWIEVLHMKVGWNITYNVRTVVLYMGECPIVCYLFLAWFSSALLHTVPVHWIIIDLYMAQWL